VLRALNVKLKNTNKKDVIIVVADMFLDKYGRLDENKTKCDVLLIHNNSYVKHVVQIFNKPSETLNIFSKMMKIEITKKTIKHLQGALKNTVCINKNDEKTQIGRHIELRQSMFIPRLTENIIETEYIVDELRAGIFHCWKGKCCKQRPKYLELVTETTIPLFKPEYDIVKGFETGPYMRLYEDKESGRGVVSVYLEHKINFKHNNDQQIGSLVSKEHSMQLKKYYPRINHHCTWNTIPLAKYMVNFPTGTAKDPFSMNSTLTMDILMNIPCKRKHTEAIMNNMQSFFTVEIPWIFRMFTWECEIFDNAQDMEKVQGAWSEVNHTSASYKYLLSMFFPDEMAESLKLSIDSQLEQNKHEDESDLYNGNVHSLFVGINPTLNTIKCMCTDLVLGMILISNGMFCHRENVCQLIYMVEYMNTVFQLDSSDEMPPYLYLNHAKPAQIHMCYADMRIMHKNTRQILIPEYISDIMNEVFFGGSIMTHDDECKEKIPSKVNDKNVYLFQREIRHRLGRDLDGTSYQELKLATNVLMYQTGIYKQQINEDSRIYDLRNITATMSLADIRKLSKTQDLIRKFAFVSKKNKTFKRTGYVDESIKYKRCVFKFLEDFRKHMDSDILDMIKTKKNAITILDKEIEDEIHQILTVNTMQFMGQK